MALTLAVMPASPARTGTPDLCDAAARQASAEHDVPLELLRAIARAETGRQQDGALQPWPWAVNEGGKGHWFVSLAAAETHADATIAAGATNIDIGCFQLNYRWHGHAFRSVADMFDPLGNARHAAGFLAQLYRETGDWRLAAGAYHSRTPALAERYAARIDRLLGAPPALAPPAPKVANDNTFPLLRLGAVGAPGSLMPRHDPGRALLRGAAAPLVGG